MMTHIRSLQIFMNSLTLNFRKHTYAFQYYKEIYPIISSRCRSLSCTPCSNPCTTSSSSWRQTLVSNISPHRCCSSVSDHTIFRDYVGSLLEEYSQIQRQMSDEENATGMPKEVNKRYIKMTPIISILKDLEDKFAESKDLEKLLIGGQLEFQRSEQNFHESLQEPDLSPDDTDLKSAAEEEKISCDKKISQLKEKLVDLFISDDLGCSEVILEASAGVGGQEAMLFTGEMFEMYRNYAAYRNWDFYTVDYEKSDVGGVRRASGMLRGPGVYSLMKFEAGVHRVQRVPKTEKTGRVHTSTMTIAILPQPAEIDVVLKPKDLQIDTCKSSGKGGQHVNKTESTVRIIHLPSGTIVECQQERSQIKNREIAMKILRSRIYEKQLLSQESETKAQRKIQVGTASRSEKIRTYNFSQDRITDHRLSHNFTNIREFILGGEGLHSVICHLQRHAKENALNQQLEEFRIHQKGQQS